MEVVRDDDRQARLGRQPQQLLVEAPLFGQSVILELEEEVVLAENVRVLPGERLRALPVVDFKGTRDLPVQAGAEPDQTLRMAGQVLAIDARLVVIAVDMGVGDEAAQVEVTGPILREQHEVVGLGVGLALAVAHRAAGDVGLHAEDWLDALREGSLVEGNRAVQGAVVGQRE